MNNLQKTFHTTGEAETNNTKRIQYRIEIDRWSIEEDEKETKKL